MLSPRSSAAKALSIDDPLSVSAQGDDLFVHLRGRSWKPAVSIAVAIDAPDAVSFALSFEVRWIDYNHQSFLVLAPAPALSEFLSGGLSLEDFLLKRVAFAISLVLSGGNQSFLYSTALYHGGGLASSVVDAQGPGFLVGEPYDLRVKIDSRGASVRFIAASPAGSFYQPTLRVPREATPAISPGAYRLALMGRQERPASLIRLGSIQVAGGRFLPSEEDAMLARARLAFARRQWTRAAEIYDAAAYLEEEDLIARSFAHIAPSLDAGGCPVESPEWKDIEAAHVARPECDLLLRARLGALFAKEDWQAVRSLQTVLMKAGHEHAAELVHHLGRTFDGYRALLASEEEPSSD
ncbi:MAG: hypothetical protein JXP34_26715 [Planctomycetes bacterium]|nr:hypothetical protein [Planctomycetota bacterium]